MFAAFRRFKGLFAVAALGIAVSFVAVDMAEARRASGGFGSRGTRTYSAPPSTSTAPGQTAPINRSMTPNTNQNQATPGAAQPARPGAQAPQQNRGLFGGMMGGLMGGLLMGGLFGMLLGGGFGGMAGFFGMLLQVALIGLLVMFAMRFFASRRQGQPAYGSAGGSQRTDNSGSSFNGGSQAGSSASSFKIPKIGALAGAAGGVAAATAAKPVPHANAVSEGDEIGITQGDLETFQKMLEDVQAAYAAEDYGTLRKLTTPEAMSYLAEELSDNATSGVKNDVRDVTLLQGDVAEAWHEEGQDYATVAMRYSAIDVMRDRNSGKVIEGDEQHPSEAVEMWTFVRRAGNDNWQVAAIQAAA
ncbi:Tim44 domain-containing protein [Agrobacterium sp. SOY23]|uniref:Tim44 domain-containing protein n=1 Tax=Agrobacterium sp. SOY23 TaxID=3014555 RepID=UPI0022AE8B19|nr:Tim44 domain-containing protein [Agrobacterium sp. SOY23]MCZ4432408.1 Tim44 domain-containing protein [Agrobacterium sp. SOY23]